jgi:hypothetical protein
MISKNKPCVMVLWCVSFLLGNLSNGMAYADCGAMIKLLSGPDYVKNGVIAHIITNGIGVKDGGQQTVPASMYVVGHLKSEVDSGRLNYSGNAKAIYSSQDAIDTPAFDNSDIKQYQILLSVNNDNIKSFRPSIAIMEVGHAEAFVPLTCEAGVAYGTYYIGMSPNIYTFSFSLAPAPQ